MNTTAVQSYPVKVVLKVRISKAHLVLQCSPVVS